MPNNKNSQRGFVETVALLGIALMLLTLPLAGKLVSQRQEVRKFAEEPKCSVVDKCPGTTEPGVCYSWAGSGCDWEGPRQAPQGKCVCKLSQQQTTPSQIDQTTSGQPDLTNVSCPKENSSWCKDGKRYYCNENKSLTPISQKWQEGNYCYVCGATTKEPVALSQCSANITNQCGGRNNGDIWCEGSTMVQCIRDPSGYLVKNITSTPCSSAQTTTTSEKPAVPAAAITPDSQGPCGGNDGRCPYNTLCMCKLVNGLWTVAESSKQTGFAACCSQTIPAQAPATVAQPTCETKTCTNKTASGNTVYYYQLCKNGACQGPYSSCSGLNQISLDTYCPTAPAPPAAVTHLYICEEENGTSYAKYYENNTLMRSKPCWYGCKSDRECNPAPTQPTTNISQPTPTVAVVTPTQGTSQGREAVKEAREIAEDVIFNVAEQVTKPSPAQATATQKPQPTTNISKPTPTVAVVAPTQRASQRREAEGLAQPTQKPLAQKPVTAPSQQKSKCPPELQLFFSGIGTFAGPAGSLSGIIICKLFF